jgi:large subunit ribosomal protein L24
MFRAFSNMWKSSRQPRKQRKYRYNAPSHLQGKFIRAPLSKDLRKKHGKRTLRVRTGDKAKVLRGRFRGHEGKVDNVSVKDTKIFIEKAEVMKKDGSKAFLPIDPSNVIITELADDKKRLKGEKK